MSGFTRIEGRERGEVLLYALSTCVWCMKTRKLLDSLGVAYSFIHVDLLPSGEQDGVMARMQILNPRRSFPTIVIDGARTILGFDEKAIREALE